MRVLVLLHKSPKFVVHSTHMRQIAAIVLLFVFFLYHLGYYGFYLLASYQLDNYWHAKAFDDELEEENVLHTAIPLAVPYQSNQTEYVPASGKVEVDGNFYRVVRQRYANDTLHIMYVHDSLQKELQQSVEQWLASFIPIPQSDADGLHLWKTITKDFLFHQVLQMEAPIRSLNFLSYGDISLHHYEFIAVVPFPPPQKL